MKEIISIYVHCTIALLLQYFFHILFSSDIPNEYYILSTRTVQLNRIFCSEIRIILFIGMLPYFGVNAILIAKKFEVHFAQAHNMN
jgi:type IV secretory pathway TrbL component